MTKACRQIYRRHPFRPDLTKYFAIQAFVEDRHGTLWFGFSGGLFRFYGNAFVNVTRGGPWVTP